MRILFQICKLSKKSTVCERPKLLFQVIDFYSSHFKYYDEENIGRSTALKTSFGKCFLSAK